MEWNKKTILRSLRGQACETQEEVADALNVSPQTIRNWETSLRFRRQEDLHMLLDHYGVSLDVRKEIVWIIYGDDTNHPDNLL